ncbi:MAG: hypothetical protein ACFFAS_07805 [Promethearchaeota archaeon]
MRCFYTTLNFKTNLVAKVEEDYNKIEFNPELKDFVQKMGSLMHNFVPLSTMAIKGNIWYCIKDWQKKNQSSIMVIYTKKPEERMKIAKEFILMIKERMKHMLVDPEGQKELLDKAFEKAWNVYIQYLKG